MAYNCRSNDADYQNLEKLVQKHEAEIRNHVRTEQQLRLYIENLENEDFALKNKFSDLEKELEVIFRFGGCRSANFALESEN